MQNAPVNPSRRPRQPQKQRIEADGIVERNSNHSNSPHQSLVGGLRIADQQQHEKHSDERNQARDNDDRIERMSSGGSPRVGQITDELEGYDGSDSCAGAAQAAHRTPRIRC